MAREVIRGSMSSELYYREVQVVANEFFGGAAVAKEVLAIGGARVAKYTVGGAGVAKDALEGARVAK